MKNLRQYRIDQRTRDKYAEVSISDNDFIYPYFVVGGTNQKQEIKSLSGIYRFSIDTILKDIEEITSSGINKILLFGVVNESEKDEFGTSAWTSGNLISLAVKEIKKNFPQLIVFTDVCLCGYTNHGHCGVIENKDVDNNRTLPLLAKMALSHAESGADFVAPSAMMDGQVEAIKNIINENKLKTKILSYSAKYSSGFYGPFRDAAGSAPSFGDRKTYQMDYRTISQATAEVESDLQEGADWVMVKPAHTYLDVIQRIKAGFPSVPLAAYQVSGEYMMIKAAGAAGLINEKAAMIEALTAIKRAGTNYIISYYAKDFVRESF